MVIHDIGYLYPEIGFDYQSCGVMTSINRQSPDIALGVDETLNLYKEQGAGIKALCSVMLARKRLN